MSEIAKLEGVSRSAVYKAIGKLNWNSNEKYIVEVDSVKHITEEGYAILKKKFNAKKGDKRSENEFDIVSSLVKQLEEKDKQIAELLEQSRNYQVLLKTEQDKNTLLLEDAKVSPPSSFLARLFGRGNAE